MDEEFESLCPFCIIQKKGTGENPDTFPGAEGETRRVFNPSCSLCEQFILCPFLLRKKMDEEFESPALFALYRKKVPGKIPIPFLAQKERLDGFSTRRVRFANSLFYVPFCSAKRWTKSSSLLPFLHYTEKRYRGKSRYLSWRRRRDSTGFQPVVFALRTVYFMSLFAPQKDGRRVRVSPNKFIYTKRKSTKEKSLCFFWRRRRDSNSRAGYPTYALSRGASSPT